jgi:serine/threonine-protein kinase
MGDVYEARHTLIAKRVAVKVLRPELACDNIILGRFFQEARAVNEINHPNIVDIIDYGHAADDLFYFTMEFLEGETVADRLRRRGITVEEGRRVVMQCASALAASHNVGIIHRDLKPENLFLLRRTTQVKIFDFGIAKLTQAGRVVNTGQGEFFGTPEYMSPEQATGKTDLDGRSDIYSLGVIMYELWTGVNPFERESVGATLAAHMTESPPRLREKNPHLPPVLEAICLRCLEKNPEDRFPNMEAVELALEQPHRYMERLAKEMGRLSDGEAARYRLREAKTINIQRDSSGKSLITLRQMRASRAVLFGGAGVVLLVVGLMLGMPRKKPLAQPPPPAAAVVEAPKLLHARIVSTPPGATVSDGGRVLGTAPVTIDRPAGSVLRLELNLAEFQTARRELVLGDDQELDFVLTPEPPLAPPTLSKRARPPREKAVEAQKPAAAEAKKPAKAIEPEGLIPTEL